MTTNILALKPFVAIEDCCAVRGERSTAAEMRVAARRQWRPCAVHLYPYTDVASFEGPFDTYFSIASNECCD